MDDALGPVGQAKAERAGFVEAFEQAVAFAGCEGGADRMCPGEPGGADDGYALGPPTAEPAGEGVGERLKQSGRLRRGAGEGGEAGGGTRDVLRVVGDVDAEADDDRLPFPFEQDARQLGRAGDEVIGPFDRGGRGGGEGFDRLVEGDSGDEGEGGRGRVARPEADEGAGVEVSGRRDPGPALPALAAGLALGAQPFAFRSAGAGKSGEIVVGRARLADAADQKSDLAALAEAWPSGPTRK